MKQIKQIKPAPKELNELSNEREGKLPSNKKSFFDQTLLSLISWQFKCVLSNTHGKQEVGQGATRPRRNYVILDFDPRKLSPLWQYWWKALQENLSILISIVTVLVFAGQSQYIKIPRRRLDSDRSTSSSLDQVLHTIKCNFSNKKILYLLNLVWRLPAEIFHGAFRALRGPEGHPAKTPQKAF